MLLNLGCARVDDPFDGLALEVGDVVVQRLAKIGVMVASIDPEHSLKDGRKSGNSCLTETSRLDLQTVSFGAGELRAEF